MSTQVTLPRLGQGMESGTIVRWLKAEGDTVEKGEPLYELDTEKVTQEVEADASGVVLKILASEGDEIPVGKPVAVIGAKGEDGPDEQETEETLLASVRKTSRCVVAHEAVVQMGWGAEVAALVQHEAFDYLDAPIERVGARFAPVPFAPVMETFVVPHAEDVLQAIHRTVGRG